MMLYVKQTFNTDIWWKGRNMMCELKNRLNEIDNELSKEEVWSDLELSQNLSKEKR